MTTSKEHLKQLRSLVQLDIDAVRAYSSAIERMDLTDVKQKLIEFRADHDRHISDLAPFIERLGGEVPSGGPDIKGFFIQGFTAIRSMMSNEAALKAMKGNEELTNKTYAKALELDFPEDIRVAVQRNRDDERRHLEYITQCIQNRVWEQPGKAAA